MMDAPAVQGLRISRAQYEAIRANETASCAALASKWGVEAVGPDYHLSRAGPAVAGEWYVIRDGLRHKTTAAQAQVLDRVGYYDVHAIGPIYASASSTEPDPSGPSPPAGMRDSSAQQISGAAISGSPTKSGSARSGSRRLFG